MYCILILLALPLAAQVVSLKPNQWNASTNTSATLKVSDCNGGLCVDVPTQASGLTLNYLRNTHARLDLTGKTALTVTAQLNVINGPAIFGDYDPSNTCPYSAHSQMYLEAKGALTGSWSCATVDPRWYGRWWATPIMYDLTQPGLLTMTIPLAPDQWSSVCGQRGDTDATTLAGFQNALKNIVAVGMTFGKSCFAAHGVFVFPPATAKWTVFHYEFY